MGIAVAAVYTLRFGPGANMTAVAGFDRTYVGLGYHGAIHTNRMQIESMHTG
jgi:hypothetical protein